MTLRAIFDGIYRENRWRGSESLSGPGSSIAPTRAASAFILRVVEQHAIESVINVGCGDDLWTPELPGYVGVDISARAIERARRLHPLREYRALDASNRALEGSFGLAICRDVIQHLSLWEGLRLLDRIRRADVTYLIASTYIGPSTRHAEHERAVNVDIRDGGCYCPDLTAVPFRLPEPIELVRDGFDYRDGVTVRDEAKWLGLWKLR